MSRDPSLRLEDISEAIEIVEGYLEGYDFERFTNERKTVDAVTRRLEVIGEAVKHLPESMTEQYPEVPWRAIAGFRDVIAHSYFRAEDSIIWDASTEGFKALKPAVEELLES